MTKACVECSISGKGETFADLPNTHTHTGGYREAAKWCVLSRIRRRLVGETGQPTVAHGAIANLPLLSSDPPTIGIFLSSSDLGWNFERKKGKLCN